MCILTDYECKNGKVNIIVGKGVRREGIVCDMAGQNVSITLLEGEFLNKGSIICPGCIEICGEENCLSNTSHNRMDNDLSVAERKQKAVNTQSTSSENHSQKSTVVTNIPDSKVGIKDELDCGVEVAPEGGGFFDEFFDYFE